jgi:hypothetical protein
MFIVMRESNVENLASFHVIGIEDASWTWISFFTNFTSWFHVLPVSFALDLALSLPARRGSVVLSSVFPCHFMFKEKLLSRCSHISVLLISKVHSWSFKSKCILRTPSLLTYSIYVSVLLKCIFTNLVWKYIILKCVFTNLLLTLSIMQQLSLGSINS